jgi:hypothetical protein
MLCRVGTSEQKNTTPKTTKESKKSDDQETPTFPENEEASTVPDFVEN